MFHFDLNYLCIFIPSVIVLYTIFRKKYRKYILLLASLYLFYSISKGLVLYVILSSFSIHHFGMWLSNLKLKRDIEINTLPKEEKKVVKEKYKRNEKRVVALAVVVHIGLLLVLKYSGFILTNVNALIGNFNVPFSFNVPKILVPIGISFYTLQAVSYVVDVYHEKIEAESSLINLTLYLSFFTYLIEGPISRYEDIKDTLFSGESIKYKNLTFGFQRMAFGLFKKMIIADRLNSVIKNVFTNYSDLSGSIIFFASFCYLIQLYMEFSGTMDVAIGTAEIFGVKLKENFHNPLFSKNISEFWTRWHITLGTWFKDYIFYPVSLSKPLKKLTSFFRRIFGNYYGPVMVGSIALFCVWFSNGLWHGADWKYIFFGMYHFVLIFIAGLLTPLIKFICSKLKINRESKIYHFIQIIKTVILVTIGELFFRADTLAIGWKMFGKIATNLKISAFFNGSLLTIGLDICDYLILGLALAFVLVVSIFKEKGKSFREYIASLPLPVRWTLYAVLVISIFIFGAYGPKYIPVEPIYAEF